MRPEWGMIPPPFDPELAAALAGIGDRLPPSIRPEHIPLLRTPPEPVPLDEAFEISAHDADGVPLLLARPARVRATLYVIHGGGMVSGDHRAVLPGMLGWARELDLAVVSVGYRLAPEHPDPAPVEDCYAGLAWTAAHAAALGLDAGRVVVVGGSAGGGLAAGVALMARDRGGPALLGQLLMCPMLDDRNDTPSSAQMAGIGVWDRVSNETGWNALLGERRGGPDVSPYAAPARATDLSGLPPAFIDVGSAETFRDEDVAYATRIWQCGGVAELHVWPGGFHGFDAIAPEAALSVRARATRLAWLRRLLS